MKIDTFVQLIKDLRTNSITDDTDPNNVALDLYTNPFDQVSLSDTVFLYKGSNYIWGNGSTYTSYDSNGNPVQASSADWAWGMGGKWS